MLWSDLATDPLVTILVHLNLFTAMNFQLERDLQFELSGEITKGKLVVSGVEWIESRGQWACHWSVAHIQPETGRVYGRDPLDAVAKTLDFMSSLIRGSEADGLQMWWQERGDHGGITFPLSEGRTWEKTRP